MAIVRTTWFKLLDVPLSTGKVCIAEDCTSDGWTPKCRNSEFHRCIARRNAGPGFGLYARVDGLPKGQDRGQVLEGNKFYACEAYDNIRSGFSINVCSDGCPGAIVRNNYIQGAFHDNGMSGVLIRNVGAGTVEDNQLDILVFGNGNSNSELSGAGLFVEANPSSPVIGTYGTVVAYDNCEGDDIHLGDGGFLRSAVRVYSPTDATLLIDSDVANSVPSNNFICPLAAQRAASTWSANAYCDRPLRTRCRVASSALRSFSQGGMAGISIVITTLCMMYL